MKYLSDITTFSIGFYRSSQYSSKAEAISQGGYVESAQPPARSLADLRRTLRHMFEVAECIELQGSKDIIVTVTLNYGMFSLTNHSLYDLAAAHGSPLHKLEGVLDEC